MPAYFCTVYITCRKNFKTYEEWLGHEKRHPCPFNIWYCQGLAPSNATHECFKGFSTEVAFKAHIDAEHEEGLDDLKLDNYHVGPNVGAFFYCGFCQGICPTNGVEWWEARAQHLKDHFSEGDCIRANYVRCEMVVSQMELGGIAIG